MGFKIFDDAFWAQVTLNEGDGCWIWEGRKYNTQGKRDQGGYGHITRRLVHKSPIPTHKYAWYLYYGYYPSRWEFVCHKCDTPSCVRIDHLFLGTTQENTADRQAKGRGIKGETHPGAKLTEKDVREIRDLYAHTSYSARALAKLYGVQHPAIFAVVNRTKWRHVG